MFLFAPFFREPLLHELFTITYKSSLTPKKLYNKTDAIFSIYGKKRDYPMTFFFEFSLRPFEVVEVEWKSRLIFWGCNLQLLQSFLNFSSSPRNGKVDLCTTNGSIVLIYLTLINFLLHYLQENFGTVYCTEV